MDQQLYMRVAMGGWVYLAALFTQLWGGDGQAWREIVDIMRSSSANANVTVLALVVGVGAPPALGFLFERVSAVLVTLTPWNMSRYPEGTHLHAGVASDDTMLGLCSDEGAAFHMLFYTYADDRFISWARRRRALMFASLSSGVAALAAVATAGVAFGVFAPVLSTMWICIAVLLLANAWREGSIHRRTIRIWLNLEGRSLTRRYSAESGQRADAHELGR